MNAGILLLAFFSADADANAKAALALAAPPRGPIPFTGCGCGSLKCDCTNELGDRQCPQGAWQRNQDGTVFKVCSCGCGAKGACCVKQGGYGRAVPARGRLVALRTSDILVSRTPWAWNPNEAMSFGLDADTQYFIGEFGVSLDLFDRAQRERYVAWVEVTQRPKTYGVADVVRLRDHPDWARGANTLPPIRRRPVGLNPMRSLLFSLRKESAMELKDRDLESISAGKRRAPVAPPRPAPAPRPVVYLAPPLPTGVAPQGFAGVAPGMPFAGMGGGGGGCPGGVCPR